MSSQELIVPIEGMTCGGCSRSVTRALEAIPGVEVIEVTLDPGQARVRVEHGRADRAQVVQAIDDAGFYVPAR